MNATRKTMMMLIAIPAVFLLSSLSVNAGETVTYAAPSMQQTVDVIKRLAGGDFRLDESSCKATTRRVVHTKWYDYHIPLQKVNPSPDYVRTHLECVELFIDGYEKEIKRVESNGDVEMKDKVDICTASRESADKLAGAIRYLIRLCGGPPCEDCDPKAWQ
jgi:hypothetical protein